MGLVEIGFFNEDIDLNFGCIYDAEPINPSADCKTADRGEKYCIKKEEGDDAE